MKSQRMASADWPSRNDRDYTSREGSDDGEGQPRLSPKSACYQRTGGQTIIKIRACVSVYAQYVGIVCASVCMRLGM